MLWRSLPELAKLCSVLLPTVCSGTTAAQSLEFIQPSTTSVTEESFNSFDIRRAARTALCLGLDQLKIARCFSMQAPQDLSCDSYGSGRKT